MTYTEEQNHFFEELYSALDRALRPEGASLERVDVPKTTRSRKGSPSGLKGSP